MSDPLATVIERTGAKRSGDGWTARCPAHNDRSPSLTINRGDTVPVVLKCHAGCPNEAIADALKMTMDELCGKGSLSSEVPQMRRPAPAPRVCPNLTNKPVTPPATYTYHYADGSVNRYVHRKLGKEFPQQAPDGSWKVSSLPRVLYNLPAILQAPPNSFIYMVEGEKDADNLIAAGMSFTTTTIGGASGLGQKVKFTEAELEPLHGRHVVILPDNDDPGVAHAEALRQTLTGKAATVRVVNLPDLPPKGDVSDWLDAGGDPEDLWKLAEQTEPSEPDQEPTQRKRAFAMTIGNDIKTEISTDIWPARLVSKAMNVIFSRPGRGKTTMAAMLTAHVTTGRAWPDGTPCPRGSVIYIKGEGTDTAIRDRMAGAGAEPSKYVLIGRTEGDDSPMIDMAEDAMLLADALEQFPDTRLVILDTLDSLYPSMRMIDNANIRRCLWPLQEIADQHDLCVVILAHTNKGGYADPLDRLSGGRAIGGAARSIWYLGKVNPEDRACYMASVKCNDFLPAKTIAYEIDGIRPDRPGYIRWGDVVDLSAWDLDGPQKAGNSGDKAEECEAWLMGVLASGPKPAADVKAEAEDRGFGIRVMGKAKKALEVVTIAQKGTRPPVYWMRLPGQDAPPPYVTPDVVILDSGPSANVTTPEGHTEALKVSASDGEAA